MVKKATSSVLILLLLFGLFLTNYKPIAKAQTASPSEAVISVSGVPAGTKALAVEVTVDTSVITLGSPSSSVSGALGLADSMSTGVGIFSEADLPASFTVTVPLTGVAAGTSMVTVGMVLDMLGGTAITGASATVDASSVTVSGSSTTTSSTSSSSTSSTGGAGGMLSADTFTVTIDGQAIGQTNAVNLTIAFTDSSVAKLASGVTFMGTGATQLLTNVDPNTGVLSAVWDGTISDNKAVITGMLEAGTMAGTTMLGVSKVEAAGGTDITSNVAVTISPDSVTNSAEVAESGCGTFTFVGPDSVTGPGKAAVGFKVDDAADDLSATLNGAMVTLSDNAGVAILTLGADDIALSLSAMCSGMTETVDLGTLSVEAGDGGKAPKASSASVKNGSSESKLTVRGSKFVADDTTVTIVPTDREATTTTVKKSSIMAAYAPDECIPKGSFVNVSTPSGTGAKKASVKGSCSNSLVD